MLQLVGLSKMSDMLQPVGLRYKPPSESGAPAVRRQSKKNVEHRMSDMLQLVGLRYKPPSASGAPAVRRQSKECRTPDVRYALACRPPVAMI